MRKKIDYDTVILGVMLILMLLMMCECQFRLHVSSAKAQVLPPLYVDLWLPYVAK